MTIARLYESNYSSAEIEAYVSEIVNKITKINAKCDIYLFGSVLTKKMTAVSDLDLCVVISDSISTKKMTDDIYAQGRFSTLLPVDLLIFNRTYFNRKSEIGGVCFQVKVTGQVIYQGLEL